MTLVPATFNTFGGLNVTVDPIEVGSPSAVALSNVELDRPRLLRTRDGATAVVTSAATNSYKAFGYLRSSSGSDIIVGADANTLRPFDVSLVTTGTTQAALVQAGNNSFARLGDTSGNNYLYVAQGSGSMLRYDGSAWTTVATTISPSWLIAVTEDFRIVLAGGSSGSRVAFSGAGAPATWGANDFVELWPGDGEFITGLVRYRNLLFAFKQTKFAVFYGTSVDSTGNPIFNYRTVETGEGALNRGMACAGDEGVYFANASGVYLTSGDKPVCVSDAIEPYWRNRSFTGLPNLPTMTDSTQPPVFTYYNGRLYIFFPSGGAGSPTLIYDPKQRAWLVWAANATAAVGVPSPSPLRALHFAEATTKQIWKFDPTATTDNGSAIAWSWKSGKYPLSPDGRVAITQESGVFGTGTVTLTLSTDSFADQSGAITLGTAPTPAEGWLQKDQEGRYWQHTLSGSGVATVESLMHQVSFVKPAGIE